MTSTDFAKTIAARARARTQMLAMNGRGTAVRDHVGASLERRIERVRSAARGSKPAGSRSRLSPPVPKT